MQLRSDLSVTRRQQSVETIDLVVCDAAERIGEPDLRIDAVELCCFDHQVDEKCDPRDFRFGSQFAFQRLGRARPLCLESRRF